MHCAAPPDRWAKPTSPRAHDLEIFGEVNVDLAHITPHHNPIEPTLEGLRALAADPAGSAQRLAFLPWVAGCAVAGITDGTIDAAAAGIADLEHSTPVEPGTRFRPGSTTKLVTATVAMQCVEAGLCALDDPLVHFVPELDLADSDRMGACDDPPSALALVGDRRG